MVSKQFEKLYSRRSDGKVQVWWGELDGEAYRFHSGILDGLTVVSEWTTAKPKNLGKKNERSAEEQAESELLSHYKKKLDKDYRKEIDDVDDVEFTPMLAKDYNDYDIKFPVHSQPKLDGCISQSSLIRTKEYGYLTIKTIVEQKLKCKVASFNTNAKSIEYKSILHHFLNKEVDENVQWFEIELESGETLKLTGNHEVYLPDLECWRRVDQLDGNENLMVINKKDPPSSNLV